MATGSFPIGCRFYLFGQIADQMIGMLENAALNGQPIDEAAAGRLIDEAYDLIASAR